MDFPNHLPKTVEDKTILVIFDVTSLDANIPHNLGLEVIYFWMDKQGHQVDQELQKVYTGSITTHSWKQSFLFYDKYYLQIKETVMGTKVAPKYATLV